MIKSLIIGIFKAMLSVATFLTQPIANLITEFAPDVASFITNISNLLDLISGFVGWFWNLIPPITQTAIIGIFGFYLALMPIKIAIENASRSLTLIKRLNIFTSK